MAYLSEYPMIKARGDCLEAYECYTCLLEGKQSGESCSNMDSERCAYYDSVVACSTLHTHYALCVP